MSGEAPGQVQEMEVPELGRQATDLGRERREERMAKRRLVVHEPIEGIAPQDLRLDRLDRDRRGGPWCPIEQRELAEEPARAPRS